MFLLYVYMLHLFFVLLLIYILKSLKKTSCGGQIGQEYKFHLFYWNLICFSFCHRAWARENQLHLTSTVGQWLWRFSEMWGG